MKKVTSIVYASEGIPHEVCSAQTSDLPDPAPGEARVAMRFAPINPADLNVIEGKYPTRPARLPAIPGVEGVGIVETLGPGTEGPAPGTAVLLPHGLGTWRQAANVAAADLIPIPPDVPLEQAAMAKINPPTAYRMLHDFVSLKPGDWVIQNAANSGVGRAVIQICKAKGWKTLNIVRRPELGDELRALGADEVLVEESPFPDVRPVLALNAVGGESALRIANALAKSGTHVTYGAMGRQPVRIPNGLLIFKNIAFRGFWVSGWYATASAEDRAAMFAEIFPLLAAGKLSARVERTYPLEACAEALARAAQPSRAGKILFAMRSPQNP